MNLDLIRDIIIFLESTGLGVLAFNGFCRSFWFKKILEHATICDETRKSAAESKLGPLNSIFPYTESSVEWNILNKHIGLGQINPTSLNRMSREDLLYVIGHEFPHPDHVDPIELHAGTQINSSERDKIHEDRGRATKIAGNVYRAKMELEKRNRNWLIFFSIIAAIFTALFGRDLLK